MKLDLITNKNDEFYTPIYAIEPLYKYLKPNSCIWCPFDTKDSYYVKELTKQGHIIINTHIWEGNDFFKIDIPPNVDYIISNPPYSIKAKVFEKLFELNIPFAMLVGIVGLFESQKRFSLFKNNNFEIMYFNKRVSYYRNYEDKQTALNPPFSSVYICRNILPNRIVFETIKK